MKKMYIIIIAAVIIIIGGLYWFGTQTNKHPSLVKADLGVVSLNVPDGYQAYLDFNVLSDPQKFFQNQSAASQDVQYKKQEPVLSVDDYAKKFAIEVKGFANPNYDEAGNTAYFSHLVVTVYKDRPPYETEEQYIASQPPSDISFHIYDPKWSSNSPKIQWLDALAGDGYTIKNAVYKQVVSYKDDLNVVIYTKDNLRLALFASGQVYSLKDMDSLITQIGSSAAVNPTQLNAFFSAAKDQVPVK